MPKIIDFINVYEEDDADIYGEKGRVRSLGYIGYIHKLNNG